MDGYAFWGQTFLGNTLVQWAFAAGMFVVVVGVLRIAANFGIRRLEGITSRTGTDFDDLATELLRKTRGLFIVLFAIWLASLTLTLGPDSRFWLNRGLWVGLLFQGGLWSTGLVNYFLRRYRRRQEEEDPGMATALGALGFLVKAGVWAVFTLFILQNLGIEITPLLAGVSVGGIAVALAVQNVLGDLLGSLSIILDKPFVIGDFIVVEDYSGTVERVGLKSTHIRSVSGEQLVFSNSDLLNSRIRNYKRMQERRAVFTIGVTYDTRHEVLQGIPGMVKEVVERQPLARFERSHFKKFGDFSLDIETVYFVTVPDYDVFMDIQQGINLDLHELFEAEGIQFAFPTQTIHVEKGGKR